MRVIRQAQQAQLAQLVHVARACGYKAVGLSVDDQGSRSSQRPGLQTALRCINNGEADALLVMRLGQIGKDDRTLYNVLKTLQDHNAKLITADYQLEYRLDGTWLESKLRQRAQKYGLPMPW